MDYISCKINGKYGEGKEVKLDYDIYEKIKYKKLYCISSGYVMIWDKKSQYLHRWILDKRTGDNSIIDHIDGDLLNCCKSNLRECSVSENMQNRKQCQPYSTSVYKGVRARQRKNGEIHYIAIAQKDNVKYNLGTFDTEIHAANAYNEKKKNFIQIMHY